MKFMRHPYLLLFVSLVFFSVALPLIGIGIVFVVSASIPGLFLIATGIAFLTYSLIFLKRLETIWKAKLASSPESPVPAGNAGSKFKIFLFFYAALVILIGAETLF